MTNKIWLIKFIGIGIFVFIITKIDISNFIEIWKKINITFLFGAILSMIILIITHAIKWKCILNFFSVPVRLGESISTFWVGTFIGMVTPGKIGELLKVYFLDETGRSRLRVFLSVLIDRLTDVISLAVLGIIGSFIVFKWEINFFQYLIIFFLFGTVFFLAFACKHEIYNIIQKYLVKFIPILSGLFNKLNYDKLLFEWKKADKKPLWIASILLLVCRFLYFLSRYLLLVSLSIPLSFIDMTACVSMSALFTLLPVSINGIGTREVSFVYLFAFYNITLEQAVAFSLMILISDAFTVVLGCFPYYYLSARFSLNLKRDAAKIKSSFGTAGG